VAPIVKQRPIDIEVWEVGPENGDFPGLHFDEVREHPEKAGHWLPFRHKRYTYGPYDNLAEIVKAVEHLKPEGYLRYIIVGGDQIRFGPEDIPYGEVIH